MVFFFFLIKNNVYGHRASDVRGLKCIRIGDAIRVNSSTDEASAVSLQITLIVIGKTVLLIVDLL